MTTNAGGEAPPLKMMKDLYQYEKLPVADVRRRSREANHERIRERMKGDPEWAAHFGDVQLSLVLEPVDILEQLDADPMLVSDSALDLSQGSAMHVLVAPYHYGGRDPGSTARTFPNHERGTIGMGADAGNVEGVDVDRQEGTCWIGVGLFSSQTINVRVAPMIFWKSMWTLGVAGVVVFTSSPWADWKANVSTQAYDSAGPVTPLQTEQIVHRRLRDAPGPSWKKDDSWGSGTVPTMHHYFTIPGGTTRWFNVIANGLAEVDYSFENTAAAQCGMDLNVNLIVVERL